MPRRKPISDTVAETNDDSWAPAASTSSTSPGGAEMPAVTKTTAPTYPIPKMAQPAACHHAETQRVRPIGRNQRSAALRRSRISRSPIPVTRTSLPGGAVVAVTNRCRPSRACTAPSSWTRRSTAGRHDEVSTVGAANSASRPSTGLIDMSSSRVTTRRRIQPRVLNTDMYMWSSTKTWFRSTESRSR
jgi:hypothetical protein